jgi:hypothetical protein
LFSHDKRSQTLSIQEKIISVADISINRFLEALAQILDWTLVVYASTRMAWISMPSQRPKQTQKGHWAVEVDLMENAPQKQFLARWRFRIIEAHTDSFPVHRNHSFDGQN